MYTVCDVTQSVLCKATGLCRRLLHTYIPDQCSCSTMNMHPLPCTCNEHIAIHVYTVCDVTQSGMCKATGLCRRLVHIYISDQCSCWPTHVDNLVGQV